MESSCFILRETKHTQGQFRLSCDSSLDLLCSFGYSLSPSLGFLWNINSDDGNNSQEVQTEVHPCGTAGDLGPLLSSPQTS